MQIFKLLVSLSIALLFPVLICKAQPKPDFDFKPPIARPAYPQTKGPVVLMDEAHFNSHKIIGRYLAFANLLFRDGYNVKASTTKFTREMLRGVKVLVVANANCQSSGAESTSPNGPAFTTEEVAAVKEWVMQGGSLFLIIDHFPLPAVNDRLAKAFGIEFHNGYAIEPGEQSDEMTFRINDNTLRNHPITRGRSGGEVVNAVTTFIGSAFRLPAGGEPVLVLGKSVQSYTPQREGEIMSNTPSVPVGGWLQGGTLRAGKGRVAVFGEATMFSAEISGLKNKPLGMNQPVASQNPQFLLNIMHWLSGLLGS